MKPEKRLTSFWLFTSQIYQPKIKRENGGSHFYKIKNTDGLFNSEIPIFSYMRFFRKCSMLCRSISLIKE